MQAATILVDRAQNVSAYSFDVFDTFLLRACTTPEGVFELTYQQSPIARSFPGTSNNFVQHRIQAEARARLHARDARGSIEVGIAEIYKRFPVRQYGLGDEDVDILIDAELRAEQKLCRANPEILRKYLEMKHGGARVGFISDTYWNSEQLARILRARCPDLVWDFLFTSCEMGIGKADGLFARYLAAEAIDAATAWHIGDNDISDVTAAHKAGLRTEHYPQAGAVLTEILQRETAVFELLNAAQPSRLDGGLRTVRRMAAKQCQVDSTTSSLGVTVLGPVVAAFDVFVAKCVGQLASSAKQMEIAFLGRDGFLPHQIWCANRDRRASYIEINRRVGIIGASDTCEPLASLFSKITRLDASTFANVTKLLPPAVASFFRGCPGQTITGRQLAKALPDLLTAGELQEISASMRGRILGYLRRTIPDFESCSDLVLVDLGYSASVQKALRRIFDLEGIATRLHGIYLLTLDDALADIADGDTATGFISDLVITPHAKRMMLRNISVFEQLCSSPDGSVRDYSDGLILRETDPRPIAQLSQTADIQAGARHFCDWLAGARTTYGIQPFADLSLAARWAAAVLGRLLTLPHTHELSLLGSFQHDINLGTSALAPMIDARATERLVQARGLSTACVAPEPPMWLAGSFASISPALAYQYLLFGTNRLPAAVFEPAPSMLLKIGLFAGDGRASMQQVRIYMDAFGNRLVHIPVSHSMAIEAIAVPLAQIAPEGLIAGVSMASGATTKDALASTEIVPVDSALLRLVGVDQLHHHYRVHDDNSLLLISVRTAEPGTSIYTVSVTPLVLVADGQPSGALQPSGDAQSNEFCA